VSEDPYALKLYIDGNSYKNPGGAGGFACVAEFPEAWNRPDEVVFEKGFYETTNNRMELCACISALEYVANAGKGIGVERVLIVTDSQYVSTGNRMAQQWRSNGWKNSSGRPVENSDLWKRMLSLRGRVRVRTEIIWRKGKKSPILKSVDRAAKNAGKAPSKVDRGFRSGKVGRSKVAVGSSSPYPAAAQEATIRIYRSALIGKIHNKVYFDLYDERLALFGHKYTAYVSAANIAHLHRGNCYRVKFNSDPKYPVLTEILEMVLCDALEAKPRLE
jgi:ribonuclease HI